MGILVEPGRWRDYRVISAEIINIELWITMLTAAAGGPRGAARLAMAFLGAGLRFCNLSLLTVCYSHVAPHRVSA
jgi:hypothetical protein